MSDGFVWRDAGRTVEFRRQGLERAPALLREHGFASFELLATPRALAGATELAGAAALVHELGPGSVPEAAAGLLGSVGSPHLVALGGGRTIDVAKAVAALEGADVAALPTTMSGAEMTGIHRLPADSEPPPRGMVRPRLVIADPEAMTSQPESRLRASSMNALAHAADSICTPFSNPASRLLAVRGAELVSQALDQGREERNRAALAQGSIFCGYAIDSGLFGVHHVICQSLARLRGLPHAEINAALLPLTLPFIVGRAAAAMDGFLAAIGAQRGGEGDRVRELGGDPAGLGELGLEHSGLEEVIDAVLTRPELANSTDPPRREEIEGLIEAAW